MISGVEKGHISRTEKSCGVSGKADTCGKERISSPQGRCFLSVGKGQISVA